MSKLSTSPFQLTGKRILITGASSGIGRSCAIECARAGATIVFTGRNEARLNEVESLLTEGEHIKFVADLTDAEQMAALVSKAGKLDGVVHSAGIHGVTPMHLISEGKLASVFGTNYISPILLTQQFLIKKLIAPKGSIVFLSSVAAKTGKVGVGPYSGSKAALIGSMRPMALEVAKHGIRVNALCPGIVETPLFDEAGASLHERFASNYPLGLGVPEDVAFAVIYFLSDASLKLTGTTFSLDGGVHW
jgi:NAD(P)-dependent dehydrogenase (short-subunit alcohol dehydrogenase family)